MKKYQYSTKNIPFFFQSNAHPNTAKHTGFFKGLSYCSLFYWFINFPTSLQIEGKFICQLLVEKEMRQKQNRVIYRGWESTFGNNIPFPFWELTTSTSSSSMGAPSDSFSVVYLYGMHLLKINTDKKRGIRIQSQTLKSKITWNSRCGKQNPYPNLSLSSIQRRNTENKGFSTFFLSSIFQRMITTKMQKKTPIKIIRKDPKGINPFDKRKPTSNTNLPTPKQKVIKVEEREMPAKAKKKRESKRVKKTHPTTWRQPWL